MASSQQRVVGLFRSLMRTREATFKGDPNALNGMEVNLSNISSDRLVLLGA
jgi:hypothetical protein